MLETYTEVRAFCGLSVHYCCFIRNFAHLVHALYDLLGDEVKMGPVILTLEAEEAVQVLKRRFHQHQYWCSLTSIRLSYRKLMPLRKGLEWCFHRSKTMDTTTP